MVPDLVGKQNRVRTVPVPAAVKARIDAWVAAGEIKEGKIFRPVNRGDRLAGTEIADEKAIWQLVERYARQTALGNLSPRDLRRTCAKLCRKAGGRSRADLAAPWAKAGSCVNDVLGLDLGEK